MATATLSGSPSSLAKQNAYTDELTYFVQQQHNSFAVSGLEHGFFDFRASAAQRIPCIENFDDDIGRFDDLNSMH